MKEIFILQLENEMRKQKIGKSKLSKLSGLGRPTIDRVLDKDNEAVSLTTLIKISNVLGYTLSLRLVDEKGV
jgi:DNA-binding phage protein